MLTKNTFLVDGNYCLTCGSNKSVRLWNPYRGTLVKEYSGHGYEVLGADASFDSANLCSGGMDKCVIYWDVAQGKVLRKLRGHAGEIISHSSFAEQYDDMSSDRLTHSLARSHTIKKVVFI